MAVNKGVVVGSFVIITAGVISAVMKHQPITKVVIGGYLVAVIGGFIDLFGGGASQLAGSLVMLAAFGVLMAEAGILERLLTPPDSGGEGGGKRK